LPQIDDVGLQSFEAFIEMLLRTFVITIAYLGHQKNLVATIRNRPAHQLFAVTIVVVPSVVEIVETLVQGAMHQLNGSRLSLALAHLPDVVTSESDDGNERTIFAQRPTMNATNTIALLGKHLFG